MLILCFSMMTTLSVAQNTSTYTRYGIGDIFYGYSARTMALSFSGSAMLNSDYVEILNPASWSALTRTRIEFSFSYDQLRYLILQNQNIMVTESLEDLHLLSL